MPRLIYIFGTGTLAKLAHYYIVNELKRNVSGFIVDAEFKLQNQFIDLPIYAFDDFIKHYSREDVEIFIAIGYKDMKARSEVFSRISEADYRLINIISQSAFVANDVELGQNNFIMPGVVIEPGVKLGSNNIIWSNATICHDTKIGNHNFIASNVTVGGEVIIGSRCFLGFSSVMSQKITVGNDNLFAAQSLVLSDVGSLSRYQGVPAQKVGDINVELGFSID